MTLTKRLSELAVLLGAECVGDGDIVITGLATLQHAQPGQLSFLSNRAYKSYLPKTEASAVILAPRDLADCPVAALVMEQPYVGYAKVATLFDTTPRSTPGVHESAVIDPTAHIAPTASVGPHCVIGPGVHIAEGAVIGAGTIIAADCSIGPSTQLAARVTLYHRVIIGAACIIHSGVVIGSDGFGMANEGGCWQKVPQLGGVRIGDRVEIGANTTIDRGALDDTEIHDGVKLDNQIQVAHNVVIGENTAIAGCTAISGSVTIGRNCMIGGGTCIAGHLHITDQVVLTGMSGVYTSIEKPGLYSSGTGIQESRTWMKNVVRLRQLDEITKRFLQLEKRINELQD